MMVRISLPTSILLGLMAIVGFAFFSSSCSGKPTANATSTSRPAVTAAPATETPFPATFTPVPPTVISLPPTATPLPPIATAKIASLSVRAGPSAGYPLVGKLKLGDRRPIIGRSANGQWWEIPFGDKNGWIPADYVEVEGGTNEVVVVPVDSPSTPVAPAALPSAEPSPIPKPTPTVQVPPPSGRIYFVIQQSRTAQYHFDDKGVYSDIPIGNNVGDFILNTNGSPLDWSAVVFKLAFVDGTGAQNVLRTLDNNSNLQKLDSHPAILTPRWTSDGSQVVYIGYDNNSNHQEIYIINSDGSKPRNYHCFLARGSEQLRGLAVSKKTGDIVFVSNFSGRQELWQIDRLCNEPKQLTNDHAEVSAPAISPDGSTIAYVSNKTGPTDYEIYTMPAAGGAAFQMEAGFTPAYSPDGFWLTFTHNSEVYIMDENGANVRTLSPGDHPTWAP